MRWVRMLTAIVEDDMVGSMMARRDGLVSLVLVRVLISISVERRAWATIAAATGDERLYGICGKLDQGWEVWSAKERIEEQFMAAITSTCCSALCPLPAFYLDFATLWRVGLDVGWMLAIFAVEIDSPTRRTDESVRRVDRTHVC